MYRNEEYLNRVFAESVHGVSRLKEVSEDKRNRGFDEFWSWTREDNKDTINDIFEKEGLAIYDFHDFFDIRPFHDNFYRSMFLNREWVRSNTVSLGIIESGKAYQITKVGGEWIRDEVAYIHFQKRKMKNSCFERDILCVPNKFLSFSGNNDLEKYWNICMLHKVFDFEYMKRILKHVKYQMIEITSPLRH